MYRIIKSERAREAGIYRINLKNLAHDSDVTMESRNNPDDGSGIRQGEICKNDGEILQAARQQAGEILAEARLEGEELREEALTRAREESSREREELLQKAREVIHTASRVRQEVIRSAEPQVVELALKVAKSILKTSVLIEPGLIKDIVAEAVSLLAGEESIIVKVNPGDLSTCREEKDFFKDLLAEDAGIRFLPSEDVEKGCCIVQGQFSRVESILEDRFKILQDKLLEEAKNAKGSGS